MNIYQSLGNFKVRSNMPEENLKLAREVHLKALKELNENVHFTADTAAVTALAQVIQATSGLNILA